MIKGLIASFYVMALMMAVAAIDMGCRSRARSEDRRTAAILLVVAFLVVALAFVLSKAAHAW